jgi:hypothetical protein
MHIVGRRVRESTRVAANESEMSLALLGRQTDAFEWRVTTPSVRAVSTAAGLAKGAAASDGRRLGSRASWGGRVA